jgi:hypothetical protein
MLLIHSDVLSSEVFSSTRLPRAATELAPGPRQRLGEVCHNLRKDKYHSLAELGDVGCECKPELVLVLDTDWGRNKSESMRGGSGGGFAQCGRGDPSKFVRPMLN